MSGHRSQLAPALRKPSKEPGRTDACPRGVSGLEELQMRQTMKDVGMALSSSNKLSEKKS